MNRTEHLFKLGTTTLWYEFRKTLIPMSNHNGISATISTKTIASRQMTTLRKILIRELLVELIQILQNEHHKNCMANSKDNY